jgi:hypothetical protein
MAKKTERGAWKQMIAESKVKIKKIWLKIRHGGDGPIASLPDGTTVIFPINPPPFNSVAKVRVLETRYGDLLGQWTGQIQS